MGGPLFFPGLIKSPPVSFISIGYTMRSGDYMLEVLSNHEEEQIQELKRMLDLSPAALVGPSGTESIPLPASVHKLFKEILGHLSRGQSVSIMPQDLQVSTQKAADYLGVSRPHFVKLLEEGAIPYTKAGSHRRIYWTDLQSYARQRDKDRAKILDELARQELADGSYR